MHRTYGEHNLNGLNLTNKCNIIEKIKDKKDTAYIIKHTLKCWPSKGYQKASSKFTRQQVIPTKCGVNLQHSLKSLEEMIKSRYNLSKINEMTMATPCHRTQEFFYYRCLDGISCDKKGIYYVRLLCFIEMECTKDITLRTCFFEDQLMWLIPKVYRTRDPLKRNLPYDHSPGVCAKTGKSFLTYFERKLWMLNMKDCYERKTADLELCAKEFYCLEVQDNAHCKAYRKAYTELEKKNILMKEYFNATAKVAEKYVKQPAISDTRLIWCLGNKADTNTSIAYRVKIAPALHPYMKLGLKEYRYSNKLVWIPSLSVASEAIKVDFTHQDHFVTTPSSVDISSPEYNYKLWDDWAYLNKEHYDDIAPEVIVLIGGFVLILPKHDKHPSDIVYRAD